MQLTSIGRLRVMPDKKLTLTAQLQHQLVDDGGMNYTNKFRQDLSAWLIGLWRPQPRLRLRGRMRYLNEAIDDPDYLETSLWATLDATIGLRAKDNLRLRADLYAYLDKRTATDARSPSPELWFWLEYLAKF
jgi:outer membrane receptor protein involved in Fe transport